MDKYKIIIYSLLLLAIAASIALYNLPGKEETQLAYLSPGENGYWQVWLLDPTTGNAQQISKSPYDKSTVTWYPDGKRMLLNGGQGELAILSLENGREIDIPIPPSLAGFNDAVLSPNGQNIAFSLSLAEGRGNNDIWLMASDGSKPRKLTNMPWYQGKPSWSMDSETLYFTSGRFDQVNDIWAHNLKSGDQKQITHDQRYNFDISDYSGQLLFSSNRSGSYDIWLRHPHGKAERLTENTAPDANPNWSPNGKTIAFESTRNGGRPQIYTLDLASHEVKQLTMTSKGARLPKWFIGQGAK